MSGLSDCELSEKQINERVLKFGRREPSKGGRMIVVTDMFEWSDGTIRLEREPFEDESVFKDDLKHTNCGNQECEMKARRDIEEIRSLIGIGIAY